MKVAAEFDRCWPVIRRHAVLFDLPIRRTRSKGGKPRKFTDEQFLEAYHLHHGVRVLVAAELGISLYWLSTHAKRLGLRLKTSHGALLPRKPVRNTKADARRKQILEQVKVSGSQTAAARALGISRQRVHQVVAEVKLADLTTESL